MFRTLIFAAGTLCLVSAAPAAPAPAGPNLTGPRVQPMPPVEFTNMVAMPFVKVGDFWCGKYEVTQEQYSTVTGRNPSRFRGALRPVEMVTWDAAVEFCDQLTAREHASGRLLAGFHYTLPTETQWEQLAAETLSKDAVTADRGFTATENVGTFSQNHQGVFDSRGNVSEWCLNWFDSTQRARVYRGGSWDTALAPQLEFSFRSGAPPDVPLPYVGFRCVLVRTTDTDQRITGGTSAHAPLLKDDQTDPADG